MNNSFAIGSGTQIDLSQFKLQKLSPEHIAQQQRFLEALKVQSAAPLETDYAKVKADGKVIATISNSGFVTSSNALGGQLLNILQDDDSAGPALAQRRAEQIASAFGGEVVKSPSALSQKAWIAQSPEWRGVGDGGARPAVQETGPFFTPKLASGTLAALLDYRAAS